MRIFVIEDDATTRACLCETISGADGFSLAGSAETPADAMRAVEQTKPDAVIVDLSLHGESGVDLIGALHERFPELNMMAHTVFDDREIVFKAIKAGAMGYLLKGASPIDLCDALRELKDGGSPMSPKIARLVLREMQGGKDLLSPRERQVLRAIDAGMTYKEIAQDLAISAHTVHSHIKKIYETLQASGKKEALAAARQKGLL